MEFEKFQLTPKQISHLAAGFVLISFFIFISGYYWGKKNGINSLTEQLEAESMSDKMYSAICSINDVADIDKEDVEDVGEVEIDNNSQVASKKVESKQSLKPLYYAQLAGFGTIKAAQECEKNLALRGFAVKTVERSGGKRNWYQVVTYAEHDKEKLAQQVEQIKKIAHIKDVSISTIDKEN